jgi:hypothetical protein
MFALLQIVFFSYPFRVFVHKDEILVFWLRGFVNNPGNIASFYIKPRDMGAKPLDLPTGTQTQGQEGPKLWIQDKCRKENILEEAHNSFFVLVWST